MPAKPINGRCRNNVELPVAHLFQRKRIPYQCEESYRPVTGSIIALEVAGGLVTGLGGGLIQIGIVFSAE